MSATPTTEDLLRELAPQVLGALVRRYGHFDAAEDAVQEALVAASVQWPEQGVPVNPPAWLTTVATRRLIDAAPRRRRAPSTRGDRRGRERAARRPGCSRAHDDTLNLLYLCCHPSLSPPSQLALTLRAVGGLTTAEIATAFLVPETTMAQRISRAKQSIKTAGATFRLPPEDERPERVRVVLQVLYLVFNEGYTTSSGDDLQRTDLTAEAIRLTRDAAHAAPRRRRGHRPARAHAAHRRTPRRAHGRRRRARARSTSRTARAGTVR